MDQTFIYLKPAKHIFSIKFCIICISGVKSDCYGVSLLYGVIRI